MSCDGAGREEEPMSQQLQHYPQGTQAQYQSGTATGQQFGQQIGGRFDDSVPQQVHQLVQRLDRLESVSSWAKSRACERGMSNVAKVCEDFEDIAHLEKALVIRQSPFARSIGESVKATLQNGLQHLQQAGSQPEVQDTISEAQQTLSVIDNALMQLPSSDVQATGMGSSTPVSQGGAQQFGASQQSSQQYGTQPVSQSPYGQPQQNIPMR
jgi:hypothetical protein